MDQGPVSGRFISVPKKLGLSLLFGLLVSCSLKAEITDTTIKTGSSELPVSSGPLFFVEAPGKAYTTSPTVDLVLLADPEYTQMYVTNTPGCAAGGVWEAYNSTKSGWALDGAQLGSVATVYVKYRKADLTESSCLSDTINSVLVTSGNACGVAASSTTFGTFYDNGGAGGNYTDNQNCTLTITAGIPIKLSFTQFALENAYDFLNVYHTSVAPSNSLGTYTGSSLPPEVQATSGTMIINFTSDGGVTDAGFTAEWSPVTPDPNTKFSINNGDTYASSASVTLQVVNLSLAEMYVTNTAGCASGGSWQTFSGSYGWTLSAGDGVKTVYIKYKDWAGHETPCEDDTIELYTSPPVAVLSGLPDATSYDTALNVGVSGTFVTAYKYKLTALNDCNSSSGYSAEIPFTTKITESLIPLPDGPYKLCVVARNPAGTYQDYASATTYDFIYDSLQSVTVAKIQSRSSEGNSGETLNIVLSQAKSYNVTVSYDLTGSSAVSGTHFSGITPGTVVIPANQTTATISYNLIENAVTDGEKFLQINLTGSNQPAVVMHKSMQFRHYIVDNEQATSTATVISAGSNHTCGVLSSGVLKCWGNNGNGQVGDASTTQRNNPVIVDSGVNYNFVQASSGSHTCGITSAGDLKCWGLNGNGQLGDASTTQRTAPVAVNAGTAYSLVSGGDAHTCGITAGGVLKCWGKNTNGQLGDGTTTQSTSPLVIDAGTNYSRVAAGLAYTCGITTGGVLKCWGLNTNGKLGDGTTVQKTSPTVIDSGTSYSEVDTGDNHTCGITTAGVLKCWGLNSSGQLGNSTTTSQSSPIVIDSGVSFSKIANGQNHTCAVTSLGALKCWGANGFAQIGDGEFSNMTSPQLIESGRVYTAVSAGVNHTCGLSEGYAKCWGAMGTGTANLGQLGNGTQTHQTTPMAVQVDEVFATLDGSAHMVGVCGITTTGVLKCWGMNDFGNLGDGTTITRNAPMIIDPGVTYSKVSKSYYSACGITTAGVLKCWGDNSSGQLGDGTTKQSLRPKVVDAGTTYSFVSHGFGSTCGITTGGVLKCWGYNATGMLGDGTTTDKYTPIVIDAGTSYSMVYAQEDHTCAITVAGVLKCWGRNSNGAVGDGTTIQRNSPVVIDAGTSYSFITTEFLNTCGITTGGVLKCWGRNQFGETGDGTAVQKTTPVVIDAGTTYTWVDGSNNNNTCGITSAGVLKVWGRGGNAQIGDGSFSQRNSPVVIDGGTTYSMCRAGSVHGMAVTTTGLLKTWGHSMKNTNGSANNFFTPGTRPIGFENP